MKTKNQYFTVIFIVLVICLVAGQLLNNKELNSLNKQSVPTSLPEVIKNKKSKIVTTGIISAKQPGPQMNGSIIENLDPQVIPKIKDELRDELRRDFQSQLNEVQKKVDLRLKQEEKYVNNENSKTRSLLNSTLRALGYTIDSDTIVDK